MRTALFILLFAATVSCSGQQARPVAITEPALVMVDSIRILKDSIANLIIKLADANTVIKYDDFQARFTLARIKRYVGICERRPTSKKYFYGWVRRAVR